MSGDAGVLIEKWREEHDDYKPEDMLKRERFSTMMTLELLESLRALIGDVSDKHEHGLAYAVRNIVVPFAESGGRGSEALAKLMGLGIIDDFPKFTKLPRVYRRDPLVDKVSLKRLKSGAALVDTKIHFDAHLPDETGETCREGNSYSTTCWAQTKFNVPKGGLDPLISEMQGKLDKFRPKF